MYSFFSRLAGKFLLFSVFFSALFIAGCEDDPVSSNDDHFDAQGIYLSSGGVKLFDYYGPEITTGPNTVLGPISINMGENGHWDVQFYNSAKKVIDGPMDDEDHYMVVEIKDPTIAAVEDEHGELRDTPSVVDGWMQYRFNTGVYEFHLNGVTDDAETSMRIKVYHIDHADFTTLEIKIAVGHGEHGEHFEPNGVYLSKGGVKIFDYFGPDITTGPSTVLGPISLSLGDNGHWDVQFYDEDRDIIDGPADEEEHFLVIDVKDTTVAKISDPHSDLNGKPVTEGGWTKYFFKPGVYDFHMNGLKLNGETNIRIHVYHEDHSDFQSLEINLKIETGTIATRKLSLFEGETSRASSYEDAEPANSYYADGAITSGSVSVTNGGSVVLISKFFNATLDASSSTLTDGSQFQPNLAGHGLKITSTDPTVVSVGTVGETNPGGTGTSNLWTFPINGLKAGTTTLLVQITDKASGNVARSFHLITVNVN